MTTKDAKIRVLIAEDSPTARGLLVAVLEEDPDIEVVGEAKNGVEAVELTKRLAPDLVTMDIRMPLMDGLEATKEIMIETPTPIVIVSGHVDGREVTVSMQALSAGALAVLAKPRGIEHPDFAATSRELLDTVRTMSQVRVVRHWRAHEAAPVVVPQIPPPAPRVKCDVVAITISTGGPAALKQLISALPSDFPTPVMVVQHIANGFVTGLANWLNTVSSLRVKLAEDGEDLLPSTVYLAPDDRHMGVSWHNGGSVALSDALPIKGFRPSGTHLFESVATVFGPAVVAVIMTGMGDDGVEGLRKVREAGGRIVAQDETSSVVYGMPRAAVQAGLPNVVLPLAAIVSQLAGPPDDLV